ncbi:MAG: class I SAM-dependent methyltransferase [Oscillospiraceae bacterium]|nr:class I SAM-dependent methyltransferase [Oscillospiraceae bacterium]
MANDWKRIWSERTLENEEIDFSDPKRLFVELKRCNGFDTMGGKISDDALVLQYENIKKRLTDGAPEKINSVYEVGCGSGANLFLFERDGYTCGGIDYSQALIDIAKRVLHSDDLVCDEAVNCREEPVYGCVLSNSVISYFTDTQYTYAVLEKMYKKTLYSIGLIDVHDADKEADFISYRKKTIENYEEKYAGLPKLFYSREFFEEFADKHNMRIEFCPSEVENYWNNDYIFNCFMYKK